MRKLWPWALFVIVFGHGFSGLTQGLVAAARDLSGEVFPETFFLIESWRRGEVPWWLPHARLGQPFAALLYTQALYLPRVLTGALFGHVLGPTVMHAFHAALSFTGLFFAARRWALSRAQAFIAAAPFSLSPFFLELAQNLQFASTAAWAGWLVWGVEGLRRAPSPRRMSLVALLLGAAFHAGGPEMWLWEVMLLGVLGWRVWRWLLPALALGGALGAVVGLPALELVRAWSGVGPAPGALEWSLAPAQLLSLFVPDADVPRAGEYWGGDQRFIFTLFIGTGAVGLAAFAGARRKALWGFAALMLVLALGAHSLPSTWALGLPPFRFFRYPVKYAVGLLFALSLLAGFGARRLGALLRARRFEAPLAVGGAAAGLLVASQWVDGREGFRAHGWWPAAVLGGVVLLARRPKWLAAVIALELVAAPVERWEWTPRQALTTPSRLAPLLRGARRVSLRVDLDDHDHLACGPWELEGDPLPAGRDRLSALRFVEEDVWATGGYGFRDPWRLARAFRHPNAYAVTGVDTFVRETWAPAPPGASRVELSPIEDVWIWRSEGPVARAQVFNAWRVGDDDRAFEALARSPVELVVSGGQPSTGGPCASTVEIDDRSATEVALAVRACAASMVTLGDAWFPGWEVTVDGRAAEALRGWGFVRAVAVPEGAHEVVWRYRPWSVRLGALISLASLLVLLAGMLWPRARRA